MHTTKRQIVNQAQALADAEQRVYVVVRFGDASTGHLVAKPATFWTLGDLLARSHVTVVAPAQPGRVASAEQVLREAFAR